MKDSETLQFEAHTLQEEKKHNLKFHKSNKLINLC